MRIAHFQVGRCNSDSANGVDKTVFHLCRGLAQRGHQVALFSITAKPSFPVPGVSIKAYRPFWQLLPREILDDLNMWKPDVVHLHSVYAPQNRQLSFWLKQNRVPYVVTPNGGLSSGAPVKRRLIKALYRLACEMPLLNDAAFIHAVSRNEGLREQGVTAPIVAIPNGFDLSAIPQSRSKSALLKRFPQLDGKFVFMFVGRLDPRHKGLDLLLAAFAKLKANHAALVLIGPDWRGHSQQLENYAQQLGIAAQVVFTGPAYGVNKFELLGGADFFVHPSRWEGLPFAVLEAMALGLPCIVAPAANPNDVISDGRSGLECAADIDQLALALQRALRLEHDELVEMGNRARQLVDQHFRWDKIVVQMERAYLKHAPPVSIRDIAPSELLCASQY